MKKTLKVLFAVLCFISLPAVSLSQGTAKPDQNEKGNVIPPEVMKIAEKACTNCHSESGNIMAQTHLNLSKWDQYSPDKQSEKAKAMCKKVTENEMPPKRFIKNHPDAVPTSDEIKIICDWAQSMQGEKK
jgi:hypothetical protein